MTIVLFILLGILLLFVVPFIWRQAFCNGIQTNDGVLFKLSTFGRVIISFWYIFLTIVTIYGIQHNSGSWYVYIIPLAMLIVYIGKVSAVFTNRKDFLLIQKNKLIWQDENVQKEILIQSFDFQNRKTNSFEFSTPNNTLGPFLVVFDENKKEYAFDLKTMNLFGHKKSIEKTLNNTFKIKK